MEFRASNQRGLDDTPARLQQPYGVPGVGGTWTSDPVPQTRFQPCSPLCVSVSVCVCLCVCLCVCVCVQWLVTLREDSSVQGLRVFHKQKTGTVRFKTHPAVIHSLLSRGGYSGIS